MGIFGKKEPESVEIVGRALKCEMCGGARFWRREALLNSAVATFFNFDWANAKAVCLVCDGCGYIYWFLPKR